jgi:hypothetical protein
MWHYMVVNCTAMHCPLVPHRGDCPRLHLHPSPHVRSQVCRLIKEVLFTPVQVPGDRPPNLLQEPAIALQHGSRRDGAVGRRPPLRPARLPGARTHHQAGPDQAVPVP